MTVAALKYRLYGLAVASEFKLAEAEAADFIAPDVTIVRGTILAPNRAAHDFRSFLVTEAGDMFVFANVGRFLVRGHDEIVVDLDDGFDERLVGLPLLGPVIAVLLHRRGNFMLHGSCVIIDGQAEIFLGDKGAGKSTTAAALVADGFHLVADDVVMLSFNSSAHPFTFAGHQAMKVDEAMMERFPQGSGSVIPPRDGGYTSGKIRYLLDRTNPVSKVGVRCIHVLARGAFHQLRPLGTKEVLHALIRFAYFPRLGPQALGPTETAHLFRQATTLASRLQGNQLFVQNDINALGTLPEFLREEAVHALQAAG